ncbi:hypothetical protein CASFOL_039190 [Castilleja foliolosa]|uniref:BHLH domain-containing protein n=1 Tax=Castilleja foliolosa TaxID=1961234 RepID=A0ABD3BIC8_9LAMI
MLISSTMAFQQLGSELTSPQTELINPDFYNDNNINHLQFFSDYQLFDQNSNYNLPNECPFDPFNSNYNHKTSFFDCYAQNPNNRRSPGPGQALPEVRAEPSAQSIAARQRRRRITAKMQELGKLVPGGYNMNTAEMLQAAYKYIKFLQAQVGILESAASYHDQENQEKMESDEELKILLESSVIQEKLYLSEKCLVPKKFVRESIAFDSETRTR